MSDNHVPEGAAIRLDAGTRLAFERTFLAHERTQMAWLRTCLSLISFGFGIAKFFDTLRAKQGDQATLLSPHDVGVLMIGSGLALLVLATLQHRRSVKALRAQCPELPASLSEAPSAIFGLLGLLALAGALTR